MILGDEQRLSFARKARDAALARSDKYMLPDFPITDEQRGELLTYRQQLRDLPASDSPLVLPAAPTFLKRTHP